MNKNLQSKRVRLTLRIEKIHANKDHELKPRREHKQDKIRRSIVTCHDIATNKPTLPPWTFAST